MLVGMDPDVLCVQEGSGATFEEEFGFLRPLGYDVVKYSKPFRMPMFTFCEWQLDSFLLAAVSLLWGILCLNYLV